MIKSASTSLILLGILAIVAGIVAIAWPGVTVLALVAAFGSDETPGSRAMLVIGGLLSVIFGVVLFTRPGLGVAALALLFGLFAVMDGVAQIIIGTQLHSNGQFLSTAL